MTRVREERLSVRHPQGLLIAPDRHRRRHHVGGRGAGGDLPRCWPRCRWSSSPSSAFTVALGVLLDTLIVRSVLVTAINLDLGGKIWWPSKLDRGRLGRRPGAGRAGARARLGLDRSAAWAVGPGIRPGPRAVSLNRGVPASQQPTPQQLRRALARAERGAALDLAEATVLLAATGADLDRLCAAAARVRDAGLGGRGRPGVVTYSPKVFIPVTRLCRDRCHYCTFVTTPGQLERAGQAPYLSPDEVLDIAREGAELGCLEALFTLGDRPEDRWPEARRVARRARLRLDARLRPRDGGPGARGDRAAAAPEPRRDVVGGAATGSSRSPRRWA